MKIFKIRKYCSPNRIMYILYDIEDCEPMKMRNSLTGSNS